MAMVGDGKATAVDALVVGGASVDALVVSDGGGQSVDVLAMAMVGDGKATAVDALVVGGDGRF